MLREAALYAHLLKEHGFRSVAELEATWSSAMIAVMVEASFHANYSPPHENSGPEVGDAMATGIIQIEDV